MEIKVAARKICPIDGDGNESLCKRGELEHPHQVTASYTTSTAPQAPQQTSSHLNATPSPHLVLKLSVYSQRRIWCFLLLHQVLNIILLTSLAVMYGSVEDRRTVLWFLRYNFLFSQAQGFLTAVHAYVSAGYALLSVLFLYGAVSMVWHSVRQGRLCYTAHPVSQPQSPDQKEQFHCKIQKNPVRRVLNRALGVYRAFGLRGKYFTSGFFMREVVESILQTTQAYKSSMALSNTFVNQSYGILIFLNCFACVVLIRVYRHDEATGRLVCVLVDLTLDFVWGTIIPLMMFWPYLVLFHRYSVDPSTTMPLNVEREVESIVVLSTRDFVLSTFPLISSVANTRSIKRLLTNAMTTTTPPVGLTSRDDLPSGQTAEASIPRSTQSTASVSRSESCLARCKRRVWQPAFWSKFFHGLMLLYGFVILGISTSARLSRSPPTFADAHECLRRVYPWLSTKVACIGRILHCDAAGIAGEESEIADQLQWFDAKTLTHLEFSGCSGLRVPSAIHRFRDLSVLTIQDSEVLRWNSDAAIVDGHFKAIQTIRFINVTISGHIDGLVTKPLPASVEWISINSVVNMESLVLNQIGDNWKHLKYFYCDMCSLTEFPSIAETMSGLLELSLCDNSIPMLTDHHFEHLTSLQNVWLDGNPLTSLPDSLWRQAKSLTEFSFQNTNISAIPAGVNDAVHSSLVMYGFGTPLCAHESDYASIAHFTCAEMVY